MPTKLDTALALAALKFAVFPCEINGKKPTLEWRDLSSINPKTIKKWWSADSPGGSPDYNIGIDCFKTGLTVVDIDVKGEKQGKASYEKLQAEHGFPDTYTVKTPSGGIHLYYMGRGYRNSVSKLAPGIDIRSDGGYVVATGSIIDNNLYELKHRLSVAKLPDWLKEALSKFKSDYRDPKEKKKKVVHVADAVDIDWAKNYLADREPAVEGAGGDQHTFATICALKDRGIRPEIALDLITELWNPTCSPPWDHDDLKVKVENAYQYGQKQIGAGSALAVFDVPPASSQTLAPATVRDYEMPLFIPRAPELLKPRDRVFGNMWMAGHVSMLISQPGVGKSSFVNGAAVSKVMNRPLLGIDPLGAGGVTIFNNEDDIPEQERRIIAILDYHGLTREMMINHDKWGREVGLRINDCNIKMVSVAKRLTDGRLRADCNQIIDRLLEYNTRLAFFDPYAMTHPGIENSNEEQLQIATVYKHIATKANCAVVLVHHTRKLSGASSEGHSGNQDSARGASSTMGLVRSAHTLDNISRQEAKRLHIPDEIRRQYIILATAKSNMSAFDDKDLLFRRVSQNIGRTIDNETGEEVGVIVPANLETIVDTVDTVDPKLHTLIRDIETVLSEGETTVPEMVRYLTGGNFKDHRRTQPDAMTKSIRRLLSENVLTGFKGVIHLEERESAGGCKAKQFLILKPPGSDAVYKKPKDII